VYNQVRINSNYDTFIENVRDIKRLAEDSDTDVMLNAVIVKENYHQMSMLVQLAHDLGIRFLNFTLYNLASDTKNSADYYQIFYSAAFKEEMNKAYSLAASFKDLEFTTWDHHSQNGFQKCPFPWTHFFITWNGWLVPCCAKPFPKEKNFGNVFETSLMESINAESFRDFRKMWYSNQTPGFCSKCHFTCIKPIFN
jgi:radical SAM protein with 4Fe4S-binding SPASM domain